MSEFPGEDLYRELSKHHPTRGIQVASGVTCECGYWTGEEEGGKNRPVGIRGDQLDWHRTQVVLEFLRREPNQCPECKVPWGMCRHT